MEELGGFIKLISEERQTCLTMADLYSVGFLSSVPFGQFLCAVCYRSKCATDHELFAYGCGTILPFVFECPLVRFLARSTGRLVTDLPKAIFEDNLDQAAVDTSGNAETELTIRICFPCGSSDFIYRIKEGLKNRLSKLNNITDLYYIPRIFCSAQIFL